jgi:peptidoglycan/LPS O-acetylase OafA/YrhL
MAYHYVSRTSAAWDGSGGGPFPNLSKVTAYGALGVHLFFVISGFVILMSAHGRTVGHFAASRVARLYPAYWTGVILTTVLLIVIADGELKRVTWSQGLVNLTMLQEALGVRHIDGVYWTLWIELLFYLTIGVFLWRGMTYQRLIAFIALWPLAGLLAAGADAGLLQVLLIPEYSALFAAGMALYLIYAYGHDVVRWGLVAMNTIVACHQTALHQVPSIERNTGGLVPSPTVIGGMVVLFIGVVAVATLSPLRFWGRRWMVVAGALTYPLYLVHEYWGFWVIAETRTVLGPHVAVLLAVAISIAMAWLIHRFIERPMGPRLRAAVGRGLGVGGSSATGGSGRTNLSARSGTGTADGDGRATPQQAAEVGAGATAE